MNGQAIFQSLAKTRIGAGLEYGSLAVLMAMAAGPSFAAPAPTPVPAAAEAFLGVWIMPAGDDVPRQFRNTPWAPAPAQMFTPWGAVQSKALATHVTPGDCDPWGPLVNGGSLFPIEIAKTNYGVVISYEVTVLPRRIYTDGRPHPKDLDPQWMGHSVGHWEGDTLVVDTVGTNGRARPINGYIDGTVFSTGNGAFAPRLPQSDQLHVVERYRVVGGGQFLEGQVTVEDPKSYTGKFSQTRYWERRPDLEFQEYYCTDNVRRDEEGQNTPAPPPAGQ